MRTKKGQLGSLLAASGAASKTGGCKYFSGGGLVLWIRRFFTPRYLFIFLPPFVGVGILHVLFDTSIDNDIILFDDELQKEQAE